MDLERIASPRAGLAEFAGTSSDPGCTIGFRRPVSGFIAGDDPPLCGASSFAFDHVALESRETAVPGLTEVPSTSSLNSRRAAKACDESQGDPFLVVPPALLVPPDTPIRGGSRTDAAVVLDRELVKLAGIDARCRLVQARLTRRLMDARAWRELGFVRLSDYSRERLGFAPRSLEDDARVLRALDGLPILRGALESGDLSWTQARLLVRVATPENEAKLFARAAPLGTRALANLIRQMGNTGKDESRSDAPGADTVNGRDPAADDDGEPHVRWSISISATGERLLRSACEIASRSAGAPLSRGQALELIVAEAASGAPRGAAEASSPAPDAETVEAELLRKQRHQEECGRSYLEGFLAETGVTEGFAWLKAAEREAGPAERLDSLLLSLDSIDAREMDRRLREVCDVARRIHYQLGALLRIGTDRRLFREIGFATVKLYMETRLGCSARRMWSLIAIERQSWKRGGALREAWKEGRISPLAASTILPVVSEKHGAQWIERAGEVTLRRLADEVAWALDHADGSDRPPPPPTDADVRPGGVASVDPTEVQMRADGESPRDEFGAPGAKKITFRVPITVAALLETLIFHYRRGHDARWRAFERILSHAVREWTSAPRHRDPVFERDGWRCAVPGCSSRRNLHDHHVVFRSLGGDESRGNRITVCAAHHLHGIHAGIVKARGKAPNELDWEMGCRGEENPLMRLHGDRYAEAA
jgi:hypothetical protein